MKVKTTLTALVAALALAAGALAATPGSPYGGGGGGYTQLPACTASFYGVTLYVQGHLWTCVHATPDHWALVS